MDNIFQYLSKNIASAVLVTLLTGLTVTTSAAGTAKLLGSINSAKPNVPEVRDVQEIADSQESKTPSPTVKPSQTNTGNIISNTIKKIVTTITPTPSSSTNTNTAQNNNACIITLFGKQFDVFSLQSTHSGGNVFTCNSDMTTVYQGKHGTNISRMQQFLVSSGTTNDNGNSSGGTNSGPAIIERDDDKREDDNDRDDREEDHVEKKEVKNTGENSDLIQTDK